MKTGKQIIRDIIQNESLKKENRIIGLELKNERVKMESEFHLSTSEYYKDHKDDPDQIDIPVEFADDRFVIRYADQSYLINIDEDGKVLVSKIRKA